MLLRAGLQIDQHEPTAEERNRDPQFLTERRRAIKHNGMCRFDRC